MFISAYNKSFDLKTLADGNKTAANQIIGIRNELLQIISELHIMEKDITEINGEFIKVMKRLNKIYVEMPTTTNEAVYNANKALKEKKYIMDYTQIAPWVG